MYYKITNQLENHNGLQYKDGLNVDILPFSETGSCVPGGIYFTDLDNLALFLHFGSNVREITLPTDHPDFKIVEDEGCLLKWRANMVVFGERYTIEDFSRKHKKELDYIWWCKISKVSTDSNFLTEFKEQLNWKYISCNKLLSSDKVYVKNGVMYNVN
jgi:hypothetical protein